ncbi:hypothetical protein K469DRAFT_387050 [Zopfia rhizophila CBS 207.26]|uniref:Uncharacterized protein n=1 Tax=Zopfia rhizophila CBS 207.26 TaxID=1314779 RepID=A0A6A6EFM6_9PEZI|nr:hypothetical protein K469DRAFT_387050 [Zopfia rhizophila CBS 207.26]
MRPSSNKAMIRAICEIYSQKEGCESLFSADYIRGKGGGQIILLHAPSKIAADLSHEPEELEQNLLRFERNANKWDVMAFLDEADVYLERRSINELQRNSIVSS